MLKRYGDHHHPLTACNPGEFFSDVLQVKHMKVMVGMCVSEGIVLSEKCRRCEKKASFHIIIVSLCGCAVRPQFSILKLYH